MVKINNTFSDKKQLKFGVPQGSILGPILYSLYVKDIEEIALYHNVKIHVYADDVVMYTNCNEISNLKECLCKVMQWTSENFLKLNKSKTQLLCLSPRTYKFGKPSYIHLMGEDIMVNNKAKYLGVWLDENLTMTRQVNNVCAQGYVMLKNLWKISSKVTDRKLRTQLVHSCILSKINFCSALYNSLPKRELDKLDKLLKAGTRFIFNIYGFQSWQHMTPYLQQLHFLPITYRTKFKISLMVYKCFNNQAPDYLKCLLIPRINEHSRETRKDNDITWLNKHPIENVVYKCRSFRHIAPDIWDKLSFIIRDSPTIDTFKTRLKTFYFEQWLAS